MRYAHIDSGPMRCAWFAACTRTTEVACHHFVLGWVPMCERCARVVSAPDYPSTDSPPTVVREDGR